MDIIDQNIDKLMMRCEQGLRNKYYLYPNDITYSLTNRCNSYCLMCNYLSKDYENHTYYNDKPFNVTLDQFKEFMPRPSFLSRFLNRPKTHFFEHINRLSIIGGETFLNPETYDIVKYAKTNFPKLVVSILSNGSIPPLAGKDDIVNYLGMIGFSVDGATRETFEAIRTPLKYDHVMRTISRWVDARAKYNSPVSLSFAIALSTLNFHELPDLVRLAKKIGLDFIYVQPMYIHEHKRFDAIRETSLIYMDKNTGHEYLKEAYVASKETGIRIDTWESIRRMFGYELAEDGQQGEDILPCAFDPSLNRYCLRLWCLGMKFDERGELDGVCTSLQNSLEIAKQYDIPKRGTPFGIYNSPGWWKLRKDMLEGKLLADCAACHKGNSYYYNLIAKPLE